MGVLSHFVVEKIRWKSLWNLHVFFVLFIVVEKWKNTVNFNNFYQMFKSTLLHDFYNK